MKKWFAAVIFFFFAPLIVLGIYSAFDTDATVSISENRELAKFPEFSMSKFFSGDWMSEFETYYSDTFPIRSELLRANRSLNAFYVFNPPWLGEDDVLLSIDIDPDQVAHGGESAITPSPSTSPSPSMPCRS